MSFRTKMLRPVLYDKDTYACSVQLGYLGLCVVRLGYLGMCCTARILRHVL